MKIYNQKKIYTKKRKKKTTTPLPPRKKIKKKEAIKHKDLFDFNTSYPAAHRFMIQDMVENMQYRLYDGFMSWFFHKYGPNHILYESFPKFKTSQQVVIYMNYVYLNFRMTWEDFRYKYWKKVHDVN